MTSSRRRRLPDNLDSRRLPDPVPSSSFEGGTPVNGGTMGMPVSKVWILIAATLVIGAGVGLSSQVEAWFASRLQQHWHVSGWVTFASVLLVAASAIVQVWRVQKRRGAEPSSQLSVSTAHSFAIIVVVGAYLVHTGARLPQGGMEWVLTFLFVSFAASTLALKFRVTSRLIFVRLTTAYALLPLALLHGVLAHAHGYLAHQAGMSP